MKNLYKITATAALLMCCIISAQAQHILLGGSGFPKVAIVEKASGKIVWEHPIEKGWECNNAVALKDGNILFSYKKGAKVVTLDHEEVWDIKAPEGCEMQSARLLDNGNCLIAWGGSPLTILEVKPKTGEIVSKTEYDTGVKSAHGQMRQVKRMKNGNYIIPVCSSNFIHIITPEGKLVKKIEVTGKPFCVEQIKGDRYWVAGGDGHSLSEVDLATGETIRLFKDGDIKGSPLFYIGGLENNKKSLYVCNWQGHAKGKTGPQVLELDKDMNIIWSIKENDPDIKRISSVCTIKYKEKK